MDEKKKFYIDFSGYLSVEAKNVEEAEELFWKILWDKNNTITYTSASIDIDLIEEA